MNSASEHRIAMSFLFAPTNLSRTASLGSILCALLAFAPSAVADPASFDCVTEPSLAVKLGSPVASILDSVDVDRGDVVKKGQTVAQIQSSVEEAVVAANKVRANSTAEITAKQAVLEQKEGVLDRKSRLAAQNYSSAQEVDNAKADADVAKQELALAKLNQQMAQIELQRSEADLGLRTIRSPIDGIVTKRSLGPGEFVSQESTVVSIARIDPLYVETYLPAGYYKYIAPGELATVRPNDPFGGDRQAKVDVIDQVFDAASGTFGVRLALANPRNDIPAGLRCQVTFDFPSDASVASARPSDPAEIPDALSSSQP
jgi:RND family efflux transporter MFP subunit